MKKNKLFVLTGLACAAILAAAFALLLPNKEQTSFKKMPKMQRIDKAIEQEFEKTKDLATGEVPRERLLAAKQYADRLRSLPPGNRGAISGLAWDERGPNNVSGRTRAILVDNNDGTGNTVWAGGVGGGLWKTTNALAGTPSWTAVNNLFENMAISTIAQDPSNGQNIYFGTGEGWFNADAIRGLGIWKSSNGGTTWSQLSSTNNSLFYYVQKIVVASNGNVFATTRDGGLQRSTDGGASWTKVLGSGTGGGATNRAADVEIASNGDIYCSLGIFTTDGIYKSTNGGTSWTKLAGGLPTSGYHRIELAPAPSNSSRVYAVFQGTNYDCSGIYRTDNGGSSWTSLPVPSAFGMTNYCRGQAWYDLIAAVDPNNANRVFIGGIDILVSSNSGSSWSQISQWYGGGGYQEVHADQHAMVFQTGNSSRMYYGNDGGIFRTTTATNTTPTITFIGNGYNVTQFYSADLHPSSGVNQYLAGAQDNGSHRFTSAGINNTTEVTGGDGAFVHIDQDNPNIQISSYVYNYYWITSNGWGSYSTIQIGSSVGSFINPTDYDSDNNVLYGCYSGGSYSYVTSVGSSNSSGSRSISQFAGGTVTTVRVSPNVANRVYFGLNNGEVVRVDNANSASASGTVVRTGSGSVSCVTVEDGNENHILITYSNYGQVSAYETTNGGTSWTSIEGNLPDMPIRWVEFAPGNNDQALVATELGVWSTDNLNGTATDWAPTNSGLANTRVDMLAWRASDNEMIAATHGRGLFSCDDFTAGPSCGAPSGLAASGITSSGATLSWTAVSGALNYDVQYRVNGTSTWTTVSGLSGTSTSLSGLASSTTYNWQVRANCSGASSSYTSGTNFTTNAGPVGCSSTVTSYPYSNNFESALGWTNASGDDFDWTRNSGGTPSSGTGPSAAAQGTWYAYMEVSSPNYPTKNAILNGPCFDLTAVTNPEITFQYHMLGAAGTILLQASTDGSSWTTIWSQSGDQGSAWLPAAVSLNAYTSQSQLRLRFNGTSGSTWQGDICIDDIAVSGALPACNAPSGLSVSGITTSAATLSWGAVSGAVSYDVQYRVNGTSTWTTVSGVSGTSTSLSGLAGSTTYNWQVRTNCSANNSGYTAGTNFTTQTPTNNCTSTISSYPYSNNFESGLGWTNETGDDFDWTRRSGGTPSSGTGPSAAAQGTWYAYMEVSSPNYPTKTAILSSPCFDLTSLSSPEVSFQYHMLGSPGTLLLQASTNGTSWTTIWSQSGNQGSAWLSATVSLSAYASQTGLSLRFNGTSGSTWQGDICVDDIQVGDAGGSGCADTEVLVSILTDNYPSETTWELRNSGGTLVGSGGPYGSSGTVYDQTLCLPAGCYDFTIFDSYGDGICCAYGTGSYSVTSGGSTLASGGAFASSETSNICVGGAIAHEANPVFSNDAHSFSLTAYPNPFTNMVYLDLSEVEDMVKVEIFDAMGKRVWQKDQIEAGSRVSIQPAIAQGIYVLRVSQGDLRQEIKLVKSN
ncbi:MAG: fibronectin type III domain-containing protein [Bacteroidia bacterium]